MANTAILYNSNYEGTIPFSDVCWQIALDEGVAQTVTIPGPARTQFQALFSYNDVSDVFVTKNSVATVPTSGSLNDQAYNELRPMKRYVQAGDTLSFICPDAGVTYVGISLRQLNQV